MITRQVRLAMGLLATLGVMLATHVRAAETNVEVKLSGWTIVCRPDSCALAQQYPPVVPHVYDRDVERAALFALIGNLDGIVRIVGITLPVDVDQVAGVTVLYPGNTEHQLPIKRCDRYACYVEIFLGKLESGDASINLIPLFFAGEKLHYRFLQGGTTFNVESDLTGFRENYVILYDYRVISRRKP